MRMEAEKESCLGGWQGPVRTQSARLRSLDIA